MQPALWPWTYRAVNELFKKMGNLFAESTPEQKFAAAICDRLPESIAATPRNRIRFFAASSGRPDQGLGLSVVAREARKKIPAAVTSEGF
jgi:hypothetical protein